MNTALTRGMLVVAILVAVLVVWQFGSEEPSPRGATPPHTDGGVAGDPVRAPEKESSRLSRQPAAVGPAYGDAHREIEGIARLSCGVPLVGRRMVLAEPELDRMEVLGEHPVTGIVRPFVTDEDGAFRIEVPSDLESARFWLVREGYLDQLERVFSLAAGRLEIVYPGSAVDVQVFDSTGSLAAGAHVSLTVEPPEPRRPHSTTLSAATDSEGRARFVLAASGDGSVRAVGPDFEGFALAELSLPETTAHVERSLVLDRSVDVGALRLEVVAAASGRPTPYLAQLETKDPPLVVARIDSLDVPPDGLVFGLPTGEFEVRLVDRYQMPPSLYDEREVDAREVALTPGPPVTVHFEVETLARAILDLGGVEERGEAMQVFLREADGTRHGNWTRMKVLAELDPAGEVTGDSLVVESGQRYLTPPLSEGFFELVLRGYRSQEEVAREFVELRTGVLPVVWFEAP